MPSGAGQISLHLRRSAILRNRGCCEFLLLVLAVPVFHVHVLTSFLRSFVFLRLFFVLRFTQLDVYVPGRAGGTCWFHRQIQFWIERCVRNIDERTKMSYLASGSCRRPCPARSTRCTRSPRSPSSPGSLLSSS